MTAPQRKLTSISVPREVVQKIGEVSETILKNGITVIPEEIRGDITRLSLGTMVTLALATLDAVATGEWVLVRKADFAEMRDKSWDANQRRSEP